jgi:ferredoxin
MCQSRFGLLRFRLTAAGVVNSATLRSIPESPPVSPPRRPTRLLPVIDPARCTGCGRCVAVCAPHVLCLERQGWEKTALLHDAKGCTGCRLCALRCPFGAIEMRAAPPAVQSLASSSACSPITAATAPAQAR